MRRLAMIGALAMAGALLLSGCATHMDYLDAELQRGIECFEAGGDWGVLVTDRKDRGYDMVCTMTQPEVTTTEEEWNEEHAVCEPIQDEGEWGECVDAIDAGLEWQGLGA